LEGLFIHQFHNAQPLTSINDDNVTFVYQVMIITIPPCQPDPPPPPPHLYVDEYAPQFPPFQPLPPFALNTAVAQAISIVLMAAYIAPQFAQLQPPFQQKLVWADSHQEELGANSQI
jgi:hypothetical protein